MAGNKVVRLSNPLKKSPNNKSNFSKENEIIKELKNNGVITNIVLGAKYCLPTNKLNYEQVGQVKSLFGEENNTFCRSLSMSESGWLAASIDIKDSEKIKPALDKYREFAKNNEDLFISGYGEIEFTIDFSKLNMFMDQETGDIYYPYGSFFFSDNKTVVNQFAASVACIPSKYQKIKNKRSISPITSDNWDAAKITGNFTRRGHLVIFYVTEDIEKEPNVYHPVVNTIDIEVGVIKNHKTSEVEKVYIGRVERNSVCVPNEVEYLLKNVYSKYAIPSFASQQFMSDYIFSIGEYSNNYDLTIVVNPETMDQANYKFKSNFAGNNKAHRAENNDNSEAKVTEKKTNKSPSKKKSGNKAKADQKKPSSNESDVKKVTEEQPVAVNQVEEEPKAAEESVEE